MAAIRVRYVVLYVQLSSHMAPTTPPQVHSPTSTSETSSVARAKTLAEWEEKMKDPALRKATAQLITEMKEDRVDRQRDREDRQKDREDRREILMMLIKNQQGVFMTMFTNMWTLFKDTGIADGDDSIHDGTSLEVPCFVLSGAWSNGCPASVPNPPRSRGAKFASGAQTVNGRGALQRVTGHTCGAKLGD
ncbi:hypothetical protein CPB85DRAFT_1460443 [Mucidula mucida]|nr:hypothetical protein CPB85DRAFT_1460443 [Mucidula mucida]